MPCRYIINHKKVSRRLFFRPGIPFGLFLIYVFLNRLKTFLTDNMLNLACVLGCGFLVYTELYKPCGKQLMPFINHIGDFTAGSSQIDKPFLGYGDVPQLSRVFHGYADT